MAEFLIGKLDRSWKLGGWEAGRLGGWEARRLGGWEAGIAYLSFPASQLLSFSASQLLSFSASQLLSFSASQIEPEPVPGTLPLDAVERRTRSRVEWRGIGIVPQAPHGVIAG